MRSLHFRDHRMRTAATWHEERPPSCCRRSGAFSVVRDTGIEPVTSSVSGKRSPAELIARVVVLSYEWRRRAALRGEARWRRDSNPCRRLCRPLPRLSATPPSEALSGPDRCSPGTAEPLRAVDETRTRDPHLGKVMLYQLSYYRRSSPGPIFVVPERGGKPYP